MAINPSYAHSAAAHLAKVKIGDTTYWMKDADLRAIVEAFGTATAKDSANAVTSTGTALPTESAVYSFVTSQISELGKVVNLLSASDHTKVTGAELGDMVIESDGSEWLYDGTEWRLIGDENKYVLKTTTIAGIDLSDNITSSELSTALDLKAFAHASQGSVTLTNYVKGISGASYTPEGSVSVTLDQTATDVNLTRGDYTPAGSVSVVLSETATAATITSAAYTPQGTVSVTPSTASFYEVASIGKAPSVTESSRSFATAGLLASVGTGDDAETLIFTAASTSSGLYTVNFNAGELASLKASATSFVTGISAASFSGSEVAGMKVTGVTYDKATLSSASFSGTKESNLKVTGAKYDKATVSAASFTGSSATITPTLTSDATKSFTVSPA